MQPAVVSGNGVLHSFTVNHQPWAPDSAPYVIGLVELVEQEGLRLTTNLIDCELDEIEIGLSVQVGFVQREDVWLPIFRPSID
ncbi:MAG: OB-fold domain-containing protein [Acidimicrobiales bacterium]